MVFSEFHDSPLGYLGIFRGEYSFPEDDPRAAPFSTLRALTASLDLPPLRAAQYIYQALHQPAHVMDFPEGLYTPSFGPSV